MTPSPDTRSPMTAPPFDLAGIDGLRHTLQNTRGPKGLLVMFICNHCPYVKAIAERLVDAMTLVARTGAGPQQQWPSIGCSIKWRH